MSDVDLILLGKQCFFVLFWIGYTLFLGIMDPYQLKKSVLLYRILNFNWYMSLLVTLGYALAVCWFFVDGLSFIPVDGLLGNLAISMIIGIPAGLFWLFWRWIAYKSEFGA